MPKMSAQARNGYVASIRDANSPVKPKLKNVTESLQFMDWFGNWQNYSSNVSKLDTKNKAASKVAERVQFPNQPTKATASNIILHNITEKFNLKIQNQTQTQQFDRWFGDWQNEPTDVSKIVNPDGTPKVVYYDAANSGSGVYRLTDNAAGGEAAYLNIRNPYRVSQQPNPQAEGQLIRHAQQKGYDGIVMGGGANLHVCVRIRGFFVEMQDLIWYAVPGTTNNGRRLSLLTEGSFFCPLTFRKEGCPMSDYEIIMIVLTVMSMIVTLLIELIKKK